MENIEKNEIITTEAAEEIIEAATNDTNVLKTVGIIGAGLAGAALLTKYVLIPVGRKLIKAVRQKKAEKTCNHHEEDDIDLDEVDLDEIPEV